MISKTSWKWKEEGDEYFKEEKYNEAIECYEEVIKLISIQREDLFKQNSSLRVTTGVYSLELIEPLFQLTSKFKESLLNKGNAFYNLEKFNEAIQCYDEILTTSDYEISNNQKTHSFEHSTIQTPDQKIKLDSKVKFEKTWNLKGNAFYNLEKYSEAIQCFDEAIKLDSKDKSAWFNKGTALKHLGKLNEAIYCFDELIKLDSNLKEVWNNKGMVLYTLEKFEESLDCFEEATRLDFKFSYAWNNKTLALHQLKKYDEAIQCYENVIKLDPKFKYFWSYKETVYSTLGNYEKIIKYCDELLKLYPLESNPWRHKGNALLKLGKLNEGLECINKAIELKPNSKEALNDKGRIYKKKGDYDNAIKYFDECLKIDASYKPPKIHKERVDKLKDTSPQVFFETNLEKIRSNTISELDLGDLNIGDNDCKLLSEAMKINFSLRQLNLEDNTITNEGLKYLKDAIKVNNSLEILELKDNFFSDLNLLEYIEIKLEENKKSTKIETCVDWNQILLNKTNLKYLNINNCHLKELPKEINCLTELVNLNLQNNELTEIPNLKNLVKLRILNLSNNKITLAIKNEDNIYFELTILLKSKLPKSINDLILEANEGVSRKYIETIDFVIQTILNSPSINIILNRDLFENEIKCLTDVFFWLCLMNDIYIPIENLIKKVNDLKELNILDLDSSSLTIIPKESPISKIDKFCTKLILNDNKFREFPETIVVLTNLKVLILKDNQISFIPNSISQLTNLKEITLDGNAFKDDIETSLTNLSNLKSLERIWVDRNSISLISMNSNLSCLERFSICQNKLTEFGGIVGWNSLQILFLNDNNIELIPPEIKYLTNLKKLNLNNNKIRFIPFEISELKKLRELQMKDNIIEGIPVSIGELIKLEIVNFSNNRIRSIPGSMGLLTKLIDLNIKGNPILSPPIEIANNLNDLKNYWKDLLLGEQKCNYLKLIVVGEENVGKTTLIRTLNAYNTKSSLKRKQRVKNEFNNKPLSTDGIDISVQPFILTVDKSYSLPNNQLIFTIWDFGGQEVYHSTHIFFLSSNSIYLIVWDMSKKENELNRLMYWIQTIQSYIKDPMIIVVGTHLDCIDNKTDESKIYENVSKKTGISTEFLVGVSCKNGTNYKNLLQLIKNMALNVEGNLTEIPVSGTRLKSRVGELVPKLYFHLKNLIDEERSRMIKNNLIPILEFSEFERISQRIDIVGEELKRGLLFLHCFGFCLYFSNDKELNKYVILNSQWLADTMATLITTKGKFIQKGLLDHRIFTYVWREPKYSSKLHSFLFDILQKFEILIPITRDIEGDIYLGKSLAPALLSNETKPIHLLNNWNEEEKIELQRIYEFSTFLPTQIFPQFMASSFSVFGSKHNQYWRDGIFIKKENVKCLIELDVLNKWIVISFVGKNFIPLFKQIQIRLEKVLNKWENLNVEIHVTCPNCISYYSTYRNKCFNLKECFELYKKGSYNVTCKTMKENEFSIQKLVPELDSSQIKNVLNWNEIEIQNKIGKGSFSEVYKGKYKNDVIAIKKLKFPNEDHNEEYIREFLLETQFLSYIKHNNLLQFIGIVLSPPCIILPFSNYGSLFRLIEKCRKKEEGSITLTFELFLRIGLDIILGLHHLHSLEPSIMHCDLKSENILVMNIDYQNPYCVCKISDFGLSQFSFGSFIMTCNLNPRWTAPEVLEKKSQTIFSDIYSYGYVLYELLTKQVPYAKEENSLWKFLQNVEKSVIEGTKPSYSKNAIENDFKTQIPSQLYEIMESCWDNNPKNRPTSKSIIELFYKLLSKYWQEIDYHIQLPFSLNQTPYSFILQEKTEVIEFKHEQSIQRLKELSKGGSELISLCKIKTLSEENEYILKEMKSDLLESKIKEVETSLAQELNILRTLQSFGTHPNIIKLIGYFINLNHNKFYIVLEYCNGGTLENYLNKRPNNNSFFTIPELKRLFKHILFGLKYIHEKGYAHLNLNCENVLIRREKENILNLCLWNIKAEVREIAHQNLSELISSYNYMAPEVVKFCNRRTIEERTYDETKADIWSLGFVLFRMLGESFPNVGPFKESLPLINQSELRQTFQNIYIKCTESNPMDRPSINQILEWL